MPFEASIPDEALFSWESQVCQYPYNGEPGISYMSGPTPAGIVDCLIYRNEKGHVRGILNRYRSDNQWERRNNVNVWVHPRHQGQGIGTALWEEAVRRWGVKLEGQRFTKAGARFAQRLSEKAEEG